MTQRVWSCGLLACLAWVAGAAAAQGVDERDPNKVFFQCPGKDCPGAKPMPPAEVPKSDAKKEAKRMEKASKSKAAREARENVKKASD